MANQRVALIRLVRRRAEGGAKKASDAENWPDETAFLPEVLERRGENAGQISGREDFLPQLPGPRLSLETGSKEKRLLMREANAGARALAITRRSDDSADVRIDDKEPFTLTPSLADLLAIISADYPWKSTDEIVGWKSYDEVSVCLSNKEGTPVPTRSVTQRIWKLRKALHTASLNRFLVMTRRGGLVRFALRRAVADAEKR